VRIPLLLCLVALLAGGCGSSSDTGVTLTVSRDFGQKSIQPQKSAAAGDGTVLDLLQKSKFTVRAGGGAVQEIDGLSNGRAEGRRADWSYWVNGIAGSQRAGDRKLHPGDRVWWDHHDTEAAARVPAVVGAFPEPFVSGSEGKKFPIRMVCLGGAERSCDEVTKRLQNEDVDAIARSNLEQSVGEVLRILVGPWREVRKDIAARSLEYGPRQSGVFARPNAAGTQLALLDDSGRPVKTLGAGAGLVAATTFTGQQPTWIVTGTDQVGVDAAAAALTENVLDGRFAVAIDRGEALALPVRQP
jgi:Domain of unknown function (DUF4430)